MSKGLFTPKVLVISSIFLVVVGVLYFLVLRNFQSEVKTNKEVAIPYDNTSESDLYVYGNILGIDPSTNSLNLRLGFEPQGSLDDGNGTPSKDFELYITNEKGQTTRVFKKGKVMDSMDVTLSLEGKVAEYPHDKHSSELYLIGTDTEGEGIGIDFQCKAAASGYSVKITDARDTGEKEFALSHVKFNMTRSNVVIVFAWFIMALQLFLAIGIALVTISVLAGRKIELAMFSWGAALLFAMVPLRSALPGVPAIGCMSDYISFFWAEGIVGVSLATIVMAWLIRGAEPKAKTPKPAQNKLEKEAFNIIQNSIESEKEKVLT